MSAPTPGPWKADGYHVRQSGQHGTRMIADVCYTGPHHTPLDEYPQSCRIADEANARLIAASPCLLKMLQRVAQFGNDLTTEDLAEIDATIARATGKESA